MEESAFKILSAALLFVVVLASPGLAGAAGSGSVHVQELMKNVERYTETVRVEGVVSGVYPGRRMLGLIGVQEYADCNSVSCAKLILPVRWKGEMPEPTDRVLVEGIIRKVNDSKVFAAESLEKIEGSSP